MLIHIIRSYIMHHEAFLASPIKIQRYSNRWLCLCCRPKQLANPILIVWLS